MRRDLGNGQWADIADRLTFGQIAAIRQAVITSDSQKIIDPGIERAYIGAMVTGWSIRDFSGAEIPFAIENLERVPAQLADAIYAQCLEVHNRHVGDPKDGSGGATSVASSPVPG